MAIRKWKHRLRGQTLLLRLNNKDIAEDAEASAQTYLFTPPSSMGPVPSGLTFTQPSGAETGTI